MSAAEMAAEAAARGDKAGENYWLAVLETVEAAPPLTASQMSQLRVLLSAPEPGATAA